MREALKLMLINLVFMLLPIYVVILDTKLLGRLFLMVNVLLAMIGYEGFKIYFEETKYGW